MSFDPLGQFDPDGDIPGMLVTVARDFANALPSCPDGSILAGYWHWTAGHYGMDFNDYNGAVRIDPAGNFHLDQPHNPQDNAIGVNNNAPAAHTWLRNTGAYGFAVDAMQDGGQHDFGSEPVTVAMLWRLCAGSAAVSKKYGLDVAGRKQSATYEGGIYNGEWVWLTHAECAVLGGNPPNPSWYNYGPSGTVERWDLGSFVALPDGLSVTDAMASACGDALRLATHRIKVLM
jgi:hypothetical protein